MRKTILYILFIIFLTTTLFYFIFVSVEKSSYKKTSIETHEPYLKVLSKFSKKNNLEKILSSNGGTLINKNWKKFNFSISKIPFVSTWEIDAEGEFKIKKEGEINGTFDIFQTIKANRNGISIKSELKNRNYIKKHITEIFIKKGNPVIIDVSNDIKYKRLIPIWMKKYLFEKVEKYNEEYLKILSSCIKDILKNESM